MMDIKTMLPWAISGPFWASRFTAGAFWHDTQRPIEQIAPQILAVEFQKIERAMNGVGERPVAAVRSKTARPSLSQTTICRPISETVCREVTSHPGRA
jgi:hypothetical protein